MKIALTGHTNGLGKALCDNYKNYIGFSRSNGYDITIADSRKSIVENIYSCDVFINNAYDKYGQIDLLYDVYNIWKDKPKLIVSIGSLASNAAEWRLQPCLYSTIKKALDVATYQLVNSHSRKGCKIMIFKPGYMGYKEGYIDYNFAAKFLLEAIEKNINNQHEIIEIVLRQ